MENILISACLIGIPCRYDGVSKKKLTDETVSSLKTKYNLIPICPEIYGGLPTPRVGSEIVGERVLMKDGTDVTDNYNRGAQVTLEFARMFECKIALLKERSPSCGKGFIYDGTFSHTLIEGNGITASLLLENGVKAVGESEVEKIL